MNLKFDNIKIDTSRIATDQMVYLIKLMKMAKKSGIKKGEQQILKAYLYYF
jgi:hypothetical protein